MRLTTPEGTVKQQTHCVGLTSAFCALAVFFAGSSARAEQPAATAMSTREAGARYGQALGVALVCYGLKTRPDALARLAAAHSDARESSDFEEEANKVLKSWQEASSCQKAGGPNTCRLIHEWSCRDALLEIGPSGTKVPGLVEVQTPQ
jgi:hypothetical protein